MAEKILEVVNLGTRFKTERGVLKAIDGVSFDVYRGEMLGIVGESGCGKSVTSQSILRLYDEKQLAVYSGEVRFEGKNLFDLSEKEMQDIRGEKISMVFQDVYLFQDTVRNNIRFGKAGATDDEIIVAAQKACCHDFIMQLPQGYDTMIGEGGCTLSGGEKQRISIARAVLKDAQVILLDEATASLDPENEVEMQKAIDTLIKGRTVITIAHKLKTIMNANRIIVLDDGQVKEQGTHDELIRVDGLYARLWKIQESTSGWNL